ncbi:flagellar motor protein MotB [Castellaniella sp.]|uniref:flagellar motor protein MotB n=1 Tax=Castellaniella sp. TaxID=1955812 RepID=UPI0035601284
MARQNEPGRIVIRRKRVHDHPVHGGSWKIAYADFMTAMMAFFLVMWLLLLVPRSDLHEIAEYFRMSLTEAMQASDRTGTTRSVIPGGDPSPIPDQFKLDDSSTISLDRLDQPMAYVPEPDTGAPDDEADQHQLEDLKRRLESLIAQNPVLQQFRPQLLLDMTPEGLRIQILDQNNRPMFALGSDTVQPYMRDILRELALPLNTLPNAITISGHTDAMRYAQGDRSYSNWELSADRANAARRELIAGGLVEHKIKRILGLGETVNLIKEDPLAAVNRRISILVLNRQTERRIDRQDAMAAQNLESLQLPDLNPSRPAGYSSEAP